MAVNLDFLTSGSENLVSVLCCHLTYLEIVLSPSYFMDEETEAKRSTGTCPTEEPGAPRPARAPCWSWAAPVPLRCAERIVPGPG